MALCTGAVAFWVRVPVAPWSRTLQALATGTRGIVAFNPSTKAAHALLR